MKLLYAISELSPMTISKYIENIDMSIQERLFWLEIREPESYGMTHDVWEEKYDEFSSIAELSEEIKNSVSEDMSYVEYEELVSDLQMQIEDFQFTYGGLSRLTI